MRNIGIIICAYNEENTIKDVILGVSKNRLVSEIIVVNDGSKDNTGKIIKKLKAKRDITDIHLPENKGKGFAMAVGVEHSNSDIIVFIPISLANSNI